MGKTFYFDPEASLYARIEDNVRELDDLVKKCFVYLEAERADEPHISSKETLKAFNDLVAATVNAQMFVMEQKKLGGYSGEIL